jgi:hypothetical protein
MSHRRLQILLNHIKPNNTDTKGKKHWRSLVQLLRNVARKDPQQIKIITSHFSMVEIIISVGMMVMLSTIVGTTYQKKIMESKIYYARIELNQITQALIFYNATKGHYPLRLSDVPEELGISIPMTDPWGQPYIYLPRIDWLAILELLGNDRSIDEREMRYWIECLQIVARTLSELPENIDPMLVLTLCSNKPLIFSTGYRNEPIFPSDVDTSDQNVIREQTRQRAQLLKTIREKASGNIALQHAVDQIPVKSGIVIPS